MNCFGRCVNFDRRHNQLFSRKWYKMAASRVVRFFNVGQVGYASGLKLQKLVAGQPGVVLLLEHLPVYTTGIRTNPYSSGEESRLRRLGADFHRTDRGGLITFHGPGQLVAYPILDLRIFQLTIRCYVRQIEKTVIRVCDLMGLKGEVSQNTGVWIGDKKVCAIGLKASRFITGHGLALNCNTNLRWFDHIVPCGLDGLGVTSLSDQLGRDVGVPEVQPLFRQAFEEVFDCLTEDLDTELQRDLLNKLNDQ